MESEEYFRKIEFTVQAAEDMLIIFGTKVLRASISEVVSTRREYFVGRLTSRLSHDAVFNTDPTSLFIRTASVTENKSSINSSG